MAAKTATAKKTAKKDSKLFDWWTGVVFLTFFPQIISFIISFCRYGYINIDHLIGKGELIMCAFLVTAPSLIKCPQKHKGLRIVFFAIATIQITMYTVFNTNIGNNSVLVYWISGLCVFASILTSLAGEIVFGKGGKS